MDYNTERSHQSLGYLSPLVYAQRYEGKAALVTPANETLNQIEAQPVLEKAVQKQKIFALENSD